MSKYSQLQGILSARNELDDQYNSKNIFRFSPLQGNVDGRNLIFQVPQTRIVQYQDSSMNLFPQIYKNNTPLTFNTDYVFDDLVNGIFHYSGTAPGDAPKPGDTIEVTLNWVWFTDIEWDRHLNRAAGEIGLGSVYYTDTSNIAGADSVPSGGSAPSDIQDGLFGPTILLGASLAARALALRYSTRYDTSAGDQSFSPSQVAKSFTAIADKFEKRAYNARDDFYKGQGRQYRPAVMPQGYILPNWTPTR